MNDCFSRAKNSGRAIGNPHDYYQFLGVEPASPIFREFDFDHSQIGLYRIDSWNSRRRLEPGLVGATEIAGGHTTQGWVDDELLDRYIKAESGKRGSICPSLFDYTLEYERAAYEPFSLQVV